jgi:hypothetical protein
MSAKGKVEDSLNKVTPQAFIGAVETYPATTVFILAILIVVLIVMMYNKYWKEGAANPYNFGDQKYVDIGGSIVNHQAQDQVYFGEGFNVSRGYEQAAAGPGAAGKFMLGDADASGGMMIPSGENLKKIMEDQGRLQFLQNNCAQNDANVATAANNPWMYKLESTREGFEDPLVAVMKGQSNTV